MSDEVSALFSVSIYVESMLGLLLLFMWAQNFEIRAVSPPVYGPTGGITWSLGQISAVEVVPPVPASPTYKSPSGPNRSPRGASSPVATTLAFGDSCAGSVCGAMLTAIPTTGSRTRLIDELSIKRLLG